MGAGFRVAEGLVGGRGRSIAGCLAVPDRLLATNRTMLPDSSVGSAVDRARETVSSNSSMTSAWSDAPRAVGAQHGEVGQPAFVNDDRVQREYGVLLRRLVRALEAFDPSGAAGNRVRYLAGGLAFERRGHDGQDRRQRVGAIDRRRTASCPS